MPRMASVAPLMRPTVVAMLSQECFEFVWSLGLVRKCHHSFQDKDFSCVPIASHVGSSVFISILKVGQVH